MNFSILMARMVSVGFGGVCLFQWSVFVSVQCVFGSKQLCVLTWLPLSHPHPTHVDPVLKQCKRFERRGHGYRRV